ncbi:Prenylcysteine lyase-domain-containing protein [Limtongia smithiae]|uniref:Prenylcysteine lyase-domain-containing protein n=1 Tax=Limtongia smithiae TaxID=1125753 RepID=UPI0034D01177
MRVLSISSFWLATAVAVFADQIVFDALVESKPSVAIIGAGAGGASAAYYLQRYSGQAFNITVYEKNSYVGGRSTTINIHDDPRWPVELGASIFVKDNLNLMAAAKEFGLNVAGTELGQLKSEETQQIETSFGIWDGKSLVFSLNTESSWKTAAKLFYRYGVSIIRARRLASKAVKMFMAFYSDTLFPFGDLTETAIATGLANITAMTTKNYLASERISELYANELIQSATRVNYAQNIDRLQALEGLVVLSAEHGYNIEGGNWRIFDSMLKKSEAVVLLDTTVTKVGKCPEESGKKWMIARSASDGDVVEYFDQVIIAAPYHQTGLGSLSSEISEPAEVPYMKLYVTLVASTKRLGGKYFGLDESTDVPTMILTTLPAKGESHMPPIFNSISIVKYIPERKEYVYKIFSPTRMTPAFLQLVFKRGAELSWVHEKIWYPYPRLDPVTKFSSFKLSDDGLWYLNGIEQFISTMETSSLAGANVAALIVGQSNKTVIAVP